MYPGCIAETNLFREKREWFRTVFPIFMKYVTGGYVSEEEAGSRLAQVGNVPPSTLDPLPSILTRTPNTEPWTVDCGPACLRSSMTPFAPSLESTGHGTAMRSRWGR